jgi:hypothetical protein
LSFDPDLNYAIWIGWFSSGAQSFSTAAQVVSFTDLFLWIKSVF